MDIFDKCYQFQKVQEYQKKGLYPYFIPLTDNEGPRVKMGGRELIMIGSNNYLGLTKDPRVQEAAIRAVERFGTSCSGSRFLNGSLALHEELEGRLARFVRKEAALMFTTGYITNLGTISTLVDRKSIIVSDKTNHACIYDGVFLGLATNPGAVLKRYKHNDMDDLEKVMSRLDPGPSKIILTDGVFSMEGNIVDLPRLVAIAGKYNARVYVDDAHGLAVLGETGRGTMEYHDAFDGVDLVTSTFSKSFASLGGFVAGPSEVINYIKHHSRSLIFAAAIPPANASAILKSLDIIESEPQHVRRLQAVGDKMRSELQSRGFDTGESKDTPIIPILVRDFDKTLAFWRALFEAGIYTNAVVPPGVPPDRSMLRTSYMSIHSDDDLNIVLDTMGRIGKDMGII